MQSKKQYLISLYKTRSTVALAAGILVFCLTSACVIYELQHQENWGEHIFHFFTFLSNLLAAVAAILMVPYAAEGIRKKRFVLPNWIVLLQYSGAVCVAITMISTFAIVLPFQGMTAFKGTNFWLHVVSPLCTIALFGCVETGVALPKRSVAAAQIPYWIYMAVYYYNVVILGKERGGWKDIYQIASVWPVWVSVILMLAIGMITAVVLRLIHNRLCEKSIQRITRIWRDDMEDTELLIEAFGLGRYMGKHCDASDLTVPLDIFGAMRDRYGISVEALTKAFIRGALDSIEGKG